MKISAKKWLLGTVLMGAMGWLFWQIGRPPEKTVSLAPTAHAASITTPPPPVPVSPPPEIVAVQEKTISTAPVRTEIEATQRMVAMHAPLRESRIADPDSAENRIILQTMLRKALSSTSAITSP